MDRGTWQATVHGVTRVRHESKGHISSVSCQNYINKPSNLIWFQFLTMNETKTLTCK